MGGLGSGKQFGKRTTSQLTSINIKTLGNKAKSGDSFTINYMHKGERIEHIVRLTQSVCNYGGVRNWFKCQYCHRRVGVIYVSNGQCGCRKCFNLAYQSERDTWQGQQYRKANAIREQLGWKVGIAHADGEKPKGMHWKTFYKLKAEHDFRVQLIFGHTMAWCAKVQRKL